MRIIHGNPFSEPTHHALDQLLLDRIATGEREPVLRFWYRTAPAVPIGRFQAYENEVAVDYVREHGIDVVRRITGGGAMYVAPGDVITFSLYLPRADVPDDVEASYDVLDAPIVEALQDIGVPARHEPLNDIVHPDGKLGGAAQLRVDHGVLHHVTLSYALDLREMLRVLRIGEEKLSDKAVQSAEQRVERITDHTDATRETIIEAITDAYTERYNNGVGSLTDEELARADELATERFKTDDWNRQR
ncbi:lipoate--protein ligase family protein [Halocatena pleomorpha]|uniref:Lipoate--protein ligase family protein n=1 Tax=Halocatena pleomorpha TaxID=1785090 RepID=A0A3P3RDP3_9EURY|nr:biotin/lipoate A/B protein ligase family protein [Halocatena pleomorpha]RRJ31521.1 lipoate--protein ligase family protein [Halocatena pleomorpha]